MTLFVSVGLTMIAGLKRVLYVHFVPYGCPSVCYTVYQLAKHSITQKWNILIFFPNKI